MKIIYNFTGEEITPQLFKKGVITVPSFIKEELAKVDEIIAAGNTTKENSCRMGLALLKDSAPSGAEVGVLISDSTTYKEWKILKNVALKVGVDVYIDSEMF